MNKSDQKPINLLEQPNNYEKYSSKNQKKYNPKREEEIIEKKIWNSLVNKLATF
jgi:hypothetical protein